MEGRCATCKWWSDGQDEYLMDFWRPEGWQFCLRANHNEGDMHAVPDDGSLLTVRGYDDPALATAPDFGCIQWELNGRPV